jgi:hypothetical protein
MKEKYARVKVSKEELIDLYWGQKLSIYEISLRFKCSFTAIANKFKKFGIERDKERERYQTFELLSKAASNRILTVEHKYKIANSLSGMKFSEERKQNISTATRGRKTWNKGLTKLTHPDRIKYGKSKESHWNWKGGTSSKNTLIRNSPEYKEWRTEVFKRDDWTCQKCLKRGRQYIEAHHIKKVSEFPDLIFDLENGLTLCVKCHKNLHKEENNVNTSVNV